MSRNRNPPFFLLTTRLDLPSEVDNLIREIAAQTPSDTPIVAIVLDTLNRSIGGSENKDEDMGAYVAAVDALRDRFKCAIIIIHHCGTDRTRPRGHTALTGAADAQIAVKRDADEQIVATVEWMKDGPEGDKIISRLEVVEVGRDQNNNAITSCIVVSAETAEQPKVDHKERKLRPKLIIALQLLDKGINSAGQVPPANNHIPPNTACINIDLWRRHCYAGGLADTEDENTKRKSEAQRKAFNRAKDELLVKGLIGIHGEMVWATPQRRA